MKVITELTPMSKVKQLSKNEVAVLIDQCETAICDMIRIEGSDGCSTSNPKIYQLNNFIGKLITIYNSK